MKRERENYIDKAIEGLATYMDAVSRMNKEEFDYCYPKLVKQGLDHFRIEIYLKELIENKTK